MEVLWYDCFVCRKWSDYVNKLNKWLLVILVILGISCLVFNYINILIGVNNSENEALMKVPYSNQTIDFGVQITVDMISYRNVPKSTLNGTYYFRVEDIIGKCVRNDTRIGEESIFYKDFLTVCEDDNF